MNTETTLEALTAPSELDRLRAMVVGDAVIARTFDVDPASAEAIGVVVPDGWRAEVLDPAAHEHLLDRPRRATGRARFADPAAMADYIAQHSTTGTTLWLDPQLPRAIAVLNDHPPLASGWGDHRAELELLATADWQALIRLADGAWTDQRTFAERLEDVVDLVKSHDGAALLTLVNNLVGSSSRKVVTADLTGSSSTVTFEAAQSVKAPGGVDVPAALVVEVRPYRYLEFVPRIRVRVRARVHQDALQLRAELVHPDLIAERALDALAEALDGEHVPTGWIGTPR